MPWPPSSDELLDLVEAGVYGRADAFAFDLLDSDGNVIGDLHPAVSPVPTITNDTSRAIYRTLDGFYLPASVITQINTVTDRVRPRMVLQNGASYPLGTFLWANDNRAVRGWGIDRQGSLRGLEHILNQKLGRVFGTKKGQRLVDRAVDFAALRISRSLIDVDDSDATSAAAPLTFDASTTVMDAINAHLDKVAYLPAYVGNDGRLKIRKAPVDISLAPPDLSYGLAGRIIADSPVDTDDLLDAPNQFVVVENSGQGPSIRGFYQLPASAPHSVENRGYAVTDVEQTQGLTSLAQANAQAKAGAQTAAKHTFEYINYEGTADPRHDTFNVVAFLGVNGLETAWRLECRSGGLHAHTLRRTYTQT